MFLQAVGRGYPTIGCSSATSTGERARSMNVRSSSTRRRPAALPSGRGPAAPSARTSRAGRAARGGAGGGRGGGGRGGEPQLPAGLGRQGRADRRRPLARPDREGRAAVVQPFRRGPGERAQDAARILRALRGRV